MFLGAKFKFRREREMKTKGERKEEKKRNVAWWAGKKSSCCVPSIPSPAKYRHVQVIIQSGREERVFQPRHRARISHDLRQISRLSTTKVRSLSLGIVHAGGEQWVDRAHTGPVDPLENSNGHKLAPIMRAASYSTIGFLGFFSRPVRECARTSLSMASPMELSRVNFNCFP